MTAPKSSPGIGLGIRLIHLLPALSTTASLTWALGELIFLSSLVSPSVLPPPGGPSPPPTPSPSSPTAAAKKSRSQTQAEAMDKILPRYFETYFHRGVWVVLAFNTLSWSSLAFTLYHSRSSPSPLSQNARKWFGFGLVAVIAHLGFVPMVAGKVERICGFVGEEGEGKGYNGDGKGTDGEREKEGPVRELRRWLGVHRVRMVVADLPAVVCCVVGVLGGL